MDGVSPSHADVCLWYPPCSNEDLLVMGKGVQGNLQNFRIPWVAAKRKVQVRSRPGSM